MAEFNSRILIIGSGPAGYTAGIYAARAGLKPVLISGKQPGGQLTITNDVENFPGFPEPVNGSELMQRMREQAVNVGVNIVDDIITEVDFSKKPFVCNSENSNIFIGDTVIIATGASARWLGLDSEKKFLGFGVSGRPGEHLGLFNVDSILRLHFGDEYGLSVRSAPGEGCLVMVRLPMKKEAEREGKA